MLPKWLSNAAFKLSGECFIFGGFPIGIHTNVNTCFVLDTACLPFWNHDKSILINMVPFKPFKEMIPVKMTAYDGSRYGVQDAYGNTIDSLSLEIQIAYKDINKEGYVLQNVHYLPDTKKTFGASLGGYPKTEAELEEQWCFRKKVHSENSDKIVYDILPSISKPALIHKSKYLIARLLVSLANKIELSNAAKCAN